MLVIYREATDVQQKFGFIVGCRRKFIIIESFHALISCIDTKVPNDVALNSCFQCLHDMHPYDCYHNNYSSEVNLGFHSR